jgi:hypothetical protein
MRLIRQTFEIKLKSQGWSDLSRDKTGKYKDDYVNAKWYGYLLWTQIETNPNEI